MYMYREQEPTKRMTDGDIWYYQDCLLFLIRTVIWISYLICKYQTAIISDGSSNNMIRLNYNPFRGKVTVLGLALTHFTQ